MEQSSSAEFLKDVRKSAAHHTGRYLVIAGFTIVGLVFVGFGLKVAFNYAKHQVVEAGKEVVTTVVQPASDAVVNTAHAAGNAADKIGDAATVLGTQGADAVSNTYQTVKPQVQEATQEVIDAAKPKVDQAVQAATDTASNAIDAAQKWTQKWRNKACEPGPDRPASCDDPPPQ